MGERAAGGHSAVSGQAGNIGAGSGFRTAAVWRPRARV